MRIIHKFGGTSLGDAARFENVAGILAAQQAGGEVETVAVVSAMSGVTDRLIAGARAAAEGRDSLYRQVKAELLARHLAVVEALLTRSPERLAVGGLVEDRLHDLELFYRSIALLGELTARGADAVASFGEQLSSNILAAALRERGVRAQALDAAGLIVTDDHFGAAVPLMAPTRGRLQAQVAPLLARGSLPVITGYVGATEAGVTTTLGRGGSDYSAAIVGAGLDAGEVWIWSDVDGILTADPNLVPEARTLAELSYAEAAELACYGAEVLHPKTIRPVVEARIPLRILNSFRPEHPGTRIVECPAAGRELLPAIISTTGLSLVAAGSRDDSWVLPLAARALQALGAARVDVLMFSQSFSEHSLNLVVRQQDQNHCLRTLEREFGACCPLSGQALLAGSGQALPAGAGQVIFLGATEQVATVSVVGVPGWNGNGIVSHAFAALGKHGTRVIAVAQAATENAVSFCIPADQVPGTVRYLHTALGIAR